MAVATRHRSTQPRADRHPFIADPAMPADPYTGLSVCARCHKLGQPGDAQHPPDALIPPDLPSELAAAARARDAAILGETGDD